jgi:hypothetical protein
MRFHCVSAYAFAHRKTSSVKRLQNATYADLRSQFGLPSQMACNVPRQVSATYKGLWTKVKKNAEARRLGYTKRRYKGLDKAPDSSLTDAHLHVFAAITWLSTGQEVSLLTLAGRIHVPYLGWTRHVALLQAVSRLGGAKLWYDRSKQNFFLLVSLTIETPDPSPALQHQIVGIDVGSRYLATVATLDNRAQFFSGRETRAKADHYARLQKRLEPKRHSQRDATQNRARPGRRDG